jgi:hypothetical protein
MLVSVFVLAVSTVPSAVSGATASHFVSLHVRDDHFYNYDVTCPDASCFDGTHVDWGVDLLFWHNANVHDIRENFKYFFPHGGSTMYYKMNNGGSWKVDTDNGSKIDKCPVNDSTTHFRMYAPPNSDHSYNINWQYYVVATAHIDNDECGGGDKWSGKSEEAEGRVAGLAQEVYAPNKVGPERINFKNKEMPPHIVDGHYWFNNGLGVPIKVPGTPGTGSD